MQGTGPVTQVVHLHVAHPKQNCPCSLDLVAKPYQTGRPWSGGGLLVVAEAPCGPTSGEGGSAMVG
jgi:hypothetical protein